MGDSRQDLHDIPYASRYDIDVEIPRFEMPSEGCDVKVAYQLLHDELILGERASVCIRASVYGLFFLSDGNPNMNLAS